MIDSKTANQTSNTAPSKRKGRNKRKISEEANPRGKGSVEASFLGHLGG